MEDKNTRYDFDVIKANVSLAEVIRSYGIEAKYNVVKQMSMEV